MKDTILGKIAERKLSMHSKYYFWARVAALVVVSLAMFLVSIFIFNFILFSIRISSNDAFLAFGPRGWQAFLAFFPWDLLAFDAVLVGVLLWLLRQFKFGYKNPLLYVLVLVCLFLVGAGIVVDQTTGINERFLKDAREHRLPPPLVGLYGRAERVPGPGSGVCKCLILSINGKTVMVSDAHDTATQFTLMLPPNDPRATTSNLEPGDMIFVAGERKGDTIEVFGIRKLFVEKMK
ncbi:MAG: hypothetical protein V4436_00850 [Patescibacteria group bacterium]